MLVTEGGCVASPSEEGYELLGDDEITTPSDVGEMELDTSEEGVGGIIDGSSASAVAIVAEVTGLME